MFLASIVDVALKPGERIESFRVASWGVDYHRVCRIPPGWSIKAGGSATPEGGFEGEGSHGVTWLGSASPAELRDFILLTLYLPIRQDDQKYLTGEIWMPATFKGQAVLQSADDERTIALTARNVRLRRAIRCASVHRR